MTHSVRSFAFYRPGFYPTPENDNSWGKGFTEWTHVASAEPIFEGHAQTRLPTDLGFYDLRVADSRIAQAELAALHGIDGFIWQHYWFNGRRVFGRPFDEVLASGEPALPFALCWMNEDFLGKSNESIIEQTYSEEDDRQHIRWVLDAMKDERYIRIDGKPLLVVQRMELLPDAERTAEIWRQEAIASGVGNIFLTYCEYKDRLSEGPAAIGFDAAIEYSPEWELSQAVFAETLEAHDYLDTAAGSLSKADPGYRRFPCVAAGWDSTPRLGMNGQILTASHPDLYKGWLASTIQREIETHDEVIVFINAWNDWSNGAVLEPCNVWATAYVEAHAAAIAQVTPAPVPEVDPADLIPTMVPISSTTTGGSVPSAAHVTNSSVPAVSPAEQPMLSVAVVTSGDAEATIRTLRSALDTCSSMGVIDFVVIDNASQDEVPALLAELSDSVRSVRNETPVVPYLAWAQAKELARGQFVVLVSVDIELTPTWLTPAISAIASDGAVNAVSPAQYLNGQQFPSQPLTSLSGVCLIVRDTTDVVGLAEAKYVSESIVKYVVEAPITAF